MSVLTCLDNPIGDIAVDHAGAVGSDRMTGRIRIKNP